MITVTFGFCPRLLSFSDKALKQEIPKSRMYVFSKSPKESVGKYFLINVVHSLKKIGSKSWHFYKICFFRKPVFSHELHFQLCWPPPNINSIGEVCNSLVSLKSLGYWWSLSELYLGEGREYKLSFICLNRVEMKAMIVCESHSIQNYTYIIF